MLTLFGAVTGYYLARAPAELRAQKAEKVAEASLKGLNDASKQVASSAAAAADGQRKKDELSKGVERIIKARLQLEPDKQDLASRELAKESGESRDSMILSQTREELKDLLDRTK